MLSSQGTTVAGTSCCFFSSHVPSGVWSQGESLATNLSFPDFDLDYDDLGGTLQWDAPRESSQARRFGVSAFRPTVAAKGCPRWDGSSQQGKPYKQSSIRNGGHDYRWISIDGDSQNRWCISGKIHLWR